MVVMRSIPLAASHNAWLRDRAATYKFVHSSVSRFLPGEALEDGPDRGASGVRPPVTYACDGW